MPAALLHIYSGQAGEQAAISQQILMARTETCTHTFPKITGKSPHFCLYHSKKACSITI